MRAVDYVKLSFKDAAAQLIIDTRELLTKRDAASTIREIHQKIKAIIRHQPEWIDLEDVLYEYFPEEYKAQSEEWLRFQKKKIHKQTKALNDSIERRDDLSKMEKNVMKLANFCDSVDQKRDLDCLVN